jgi:hypothetical protein
MLKIPLVVYIQISRSIYTDIYLHVPTISVLATVKNEGRYTGYPHRQHDFVPMMTRRTTHRREQKCEKCYDDRRIFNGRQLKEA